MVDRNYEPTPAQETMKREMSEPRKLGEVLDEVVGTRADSELSTEGMLKEGITPTALAIINEHPSLSMGLAQWQIVQNMVEEGIRRGIRVAREAYQ